MKSYYLPDLASIPEFVQEMKAYLTPDQVLLFNGNLGTGKTTLITEIVKFLNSEDRVSSPTFSLVNEYQTPQFPIFHFDLYRIKEESELFDFGFEEYLDREALVLIEWPEIAESFLPEDTIEFKIDYTEAGGRTIEVRGNGLFSR